MFAVARLAQSVERQPFKLVVVGSSPTVGAFFHSCIKGIKRGAWIVCVDMDGSVSEWLRSRTRNPMGSARGGSNPLAVAFFLAAFTYVYSHREARLAFETEHSSVGRAFDCR